MISHLGWTLIQSFNCTHLWSACSPKLCNDYLIMGPPYLRVPRPRLLESEDVEPAVGRADCTTPFHIRDLGICGFWYLWGSWDQSPTEEVLYFLLKLLLKADNLASCYVNRLRPIKQDVSRYSASRQTFTYITTYFPLSSEVWCPNSYPRYTPPSLSSLSFPPSFVRPFLQYSLLYLQSLNWLLSHTWQTYSIVSLSP